MSKLRKAAAVAVAVLTAISIVTGEAAKLIEKALAFLGAQ